MSLNDDIQGYWKFDEASGNAADSTANNNDLTNNNTATFGAAVINNGCDLELSSNQWFDIADASQTGLDFSDAFTFAGWIKMEDNSSGPILVNKRSGAGTRSYTFSVEGTGAGLHLTTFHDGTNVGLDGARAATLDVDVWYHVAATKSGVTGKLYVDGAQIETDITGTNATVFNSTSPFDFGAIAGGAAYDGMYDEWGVWSRALTSLEITALYNAGAGLSYPFASAETDRTNNMLLMGVS